MRPSRVSAIFDAADAVTLRDVTDGAETSTATETAISLDALFGAYWQNGDVPHGKFVIGVHVTALDTSSADETYTLSLVADDVSAMNNSPVTLTSFSPTATGYYEVVLDSATIPRINSDVSSEAQYLAIKATLGGTTPSITYGAWIAKSLGA